MEAKKIYVNKYDEAQLVVARVVKGEGNEIILSIPKFSTFGQSIKNFRALKHESESAGKLVRIESVDDDVVALAKACDMEAINPFFDRTHSRFADIVVQRKQVAPPRVQLVEQKIPEPQVVEEPVRRNAEPDNLIEPASSMHTVRNTMLAIGALGFGGVLSFLALRVLPQADITLIAQKKTVAYANAIIVDKNVRVPDAATMKIPGQLFIEKKNASMTFHATGKKFVEKKAEGKLMIYNAYSSEQQKLVQKTRFVTTEGLIVRLVESIVVPGAKIVDGKIVPSTIEARVVADKAGAEYNLPAKTRLTIPGLKGTPRYDGFYGELAVSLSGGFVGERAYPSDDDIKKGKSAVEQTVAENAKATALQKIPSDFKARDDGVQFQLVKSTVNTDVNEQGMFSVFAEGTMNVMAFREVDVKKILTERGAQEAGANYAQKSEELKYGASRLDLATGKMTMTVDYKSVMASMVMLDALRGKIVGKSERELKALLLAMPGLESATVSLWPFWVRSVPSQDQKIRVVVD